MATPEAIGGDIVSQLLNDWLSYLDSVKVGKEWAYYLNVKDYGAVGDGITDDSAAIQAAVDDAQLQGRPLLTEHKTYLITSLTLKPNKYIFVGSQFKYSGSPTGYVIDCEDGVTADEINLSVPGGINERFISVRSNCNIMRIKVTSDTQHSIHTSNIDAAVVLDGSNQNIGNIEVKNMDYAMTLYDVADAVIGNIHCKSFVRGVYLRKVTRTLFKRIFTEVRSPNAAQAPGDNGLLIEESEDCDFDILHIYDAGEHAIRIGGTRDNVFNQERFTFGRVVTKRSGQCGFKAFTADGNPITHIEIGDLTTIDCAYGSTPGTNEDGLYLSGVSFSHIGNFRCAKELNGVSAYRGAYITDIENVVIDNLSVFDTYSTGVTVDEEDGAVNDLHVNSNVIRDTDNEAILINQPTESSRDIIFKNIYMRGWGDAYYGVKVIHGPIYQPVLFEGYGAVNTSAGLFTTNSSNGLLHNKLMRLD